VINKSVSRDGHSKCKFKLNNVNSAFFPLQELYCRKFREESAENQKPAYSCCCGNATPDGNVITYALKSTVIVAQMKSFHSLFAVNKTQYISSHLEAHRILCRT
jgi:hypothetical protein